ncbi:MAG: filamentous hemagglutinin N-terminal domain-containing protein [Paracoccaceae bacterium]|nr:filamentous hemagglutinin N-terminal domain-containing protein [Paracoccaceae bacterium]
MTSGPASVILNEVTGGDRSTLAGRLEVFGAAANVVIANPNGITCDGCGFINTPRVTLSTGGAVFGADGSLAGLNVAGGDITIGANGGDFTAQQTFDLVSRQIHVDGPVAGPSGQLNLIAGHNRFGYADGSVTALADDGKDPGIAIDSAALGGMYAGRIVLIATDKGSGVNMTGQMASNAGQMMLTADGKLVLQKAHATGGKISARSKSNTVEIASTLYADGGVSLTGATGVALDADGLIASAGDVALSATGAGGAVTLGRRAIAAAGVARDGTETTAGLLTLSGDTIVAGSGVLEGGAGINLTATSIDIARASDTGTNTIASFGPVTLAAQQIIATHGRVQAQGALTLASTGGLSLEGGSYGTAGALAVSGTSIASSATLIASGAASLQARAGAVSNNGTVSSGEDLSVVALSGLENAGALLSRRTLSIASAGALTNGASGTIAGGTGVALAVANLDNAGALTAEGGSLTVTTPGDIANSGTLFGQGEVTLTLDGAFDNGGQVLSNGALVLGGATGVRSGTVTNDAGGTINVARATLTAASLGNAGALSAHGGDLSADLAGDVSNTGALSVNGAARLQAAGGITNAGTLTAAADLTLATPGGIANTGTVSAGGVLTLSGLNGGAAGAVHNSVTGVIDGEAGLSLAAASFINDGQTGSGQGAIAVALADPNAGGDLTNTGLLYAGGAAEYLLDGSFTNTNGDVTAGTDLVIAGLVNPTATAVTNSSGTIEAIVGNLGINAGTIINARTSNPAITETTVTGTPVTETFPLILSSDAISSTTTVVTTTTQSASGGSAPGKILSGTDMTLTAGTLSNAESEIAASGNLTIVAGAATNQAIDLTQTDITNVTEDHYRREHHSGWFSCGCDITVATWTVMDAPTSTTTSIGAVYGTITAGGTLTANVAGYLDNNAVTGGVATSALTTGAGLALAAVNPAGAIASASAAPTVTPATLALDISSVLGKQAIFATNAAPNAPYLVETRSAFIDPGKFLGSSYFLNRVGGNPDATMKQFGDAYAETQLVLSQIYDLTGQRYIDGAASDVAQMQALYNNAVDETQALGLTVGVALTPAQQAALTQNIVWLQPEVVNGATVLTPQLYLASATAQNTSLSAARISGGTVNVSAGAITNSGAISAVDGLNLGSFEALDNTGGTLSAGGNINLAAVDALTNTSGLIAGGGSVAISAASLVNGTQAFTSAKGQSSADIAGRIATITAGADLSVAASGNIDANGGAFTAGGALSLNAGGIVSLSALALQSTSASADGSYSAKSTANLLSTLTSGGDMTLTSGSSMTLAGITANAGGRAMLQTGGDLTIASVQNSTSQSLNLRDLQTSSSAKTTDVTSITAGSSLTAVAGATGSDGSFTGSTLTLAGAALASGDAMALAGGNVQLGATTDSSQSFSQSESSGFLGFSSKSTTDQSATTSHTTSTLTSGGDLTVAATGGLESDAAKFGSGGNTTLQAATIYAGTLEDSTSSSHATKSSLLWGLAGSSHSLSTTTDTAEGTGLATASTLSLVSSGDTTLIAPDVKVGGDLNITTGGNLTLGEAAGQVSTQKHDQNNNGVVITTKTLAQTDQTASLGSWQVAGQTKAEVTGQITADLYANEATTTAANAPVTLDAKGNPIFTAATQGADGQWVAGNLSTNLDTLPDALASQVTNVNLAGLTHTYDATSTTQLNPAFQALLEIAATSWLGPIGGSLLTDVTAGAVSGRLDLGKVATDAVVAGATSYLTSYANQSIESNAVSGSLSTQSLVGLGNNAAGIGYVSPVSLAEDTAGAGISASVGTLIRGGSFTKAFTASLVSNAAGDAGAGLIDASANYFGHTAPTVGNTLVKSIVNCATATASGSSCASGVLGTLVADAAVASGSSFGATNLGTYNNDINLIAATAGYLASGGSAANVYGTVAAAALDIKNNQEAEFDALRGNPFSLTPEYLNFAADSLEAQIDGILAARGLPSRTYVADPNNPYASPEFVSALQAQLMELQSTSSPNIPLLTDGVGATNVVTGPDFYVNSQGSALAATGYRYMDSRFANQTMATKTAPLSYFGFQDFSTASGAIDAYQIDPLQFGNDARLQGTFNTLQLFGDGGFVNARVPLEKGGIGPSLEPYTSSYPALGRGGSAQLVPVLPGTIVNLDTVKLLPP